MTTPDVDAPRDLAAWSLSAEDILQAMSVDADRGLDRDTVLERRRIWGRNELQAVRQRHGFKILLAQFKSVVVVLLLAAGGLALLFSEYTEGLAIFAVLVINATIGFVTEWRAVRSMEALRQFARVECVVLRDGTASKIAAEGLVPGDVVVFEAGDLVPADLRLIAASKLTADESTLTGESLPVHKDTSVLAGDTPVMDRHNLAFKGTTITRGSGRGVVVATGTNTEFGKIFEQVASAEPARTPLEKRLNALGARLAWAIGAIAVVIAVAGVLAGRELYLAIEVAIALSVAAIPEGLAIVATIALARGMWRLAKRNALITKLSAVETLGATSVILTDKTGTLTENRMAVSTVLLPNVGIDVDGAERPLAATFSAAGDNVDTESQRLLDDVLRVAVLCNNASLDKAAGRDAAGVGDPTEVALLVAASALGLWRQELLEQAPEIDEDPFDPELKRMATLHRQGNERLVAVKGAPETLIPGCVAVRSREKDIPMSDSERQRWLSRAERLGEDGLRTLAIATKISHDDVSHPYDSLVLLGVIGMQDPPRHDVEKAIRNCHRAGISVVMVTGDHAATARTIATKTGVVEANADAAGFLSGEQVDERLAAGDEAALLAAQVFSRVTPEQKHKVIALYQRHEHVVAMTGDGVNDAPALKKADIGIAMGQRGTAVAKEAAVMVLQDDNFNTIVDAVSHGRAIFANIRKFVVYLLSCNASEVLVVSLATVAGAPLPLLPLQILFLNLVTDVFPALALGVGKGSGVLMKRGPRPAAERIMTRRHWIGVALHGAIIAAAVLLAMAVSVYYLAFDYPEAVSVAFCTLAFTQMWHVFNMRDEIGQVIDNEITRNVWVWVALAICLVLVLAAVYLPPLGNVLQLTDPGVSGWTLIIASSLLPLFAAPFVSLATRKLRTR